MYRRCTFTQVYQLRIHIAVGTLVPLCLQGGSRQAVMHPLPCRREYNALVDSTADEVAKLKAAQQTAMAKQMKLDEESLQRLAAEKEAAKVAPGPAPLVAVSGGCFGSMCLFTCTVWCCH